MTARFVFAAAQAGAERPLKNEVARDQPTLRFAFSRPGFVTFRLPDGAKNPKLDCVFARTWGYSLGKASAADDALLAREAWQLVATHLPNDLSSELRHLHIWQRDRALPGDEAYDAAAAELERAVGAALLEQQPRPGPATQPAVNAVAADGELVLDCVLVERNQWWLGWHRASSPETRWPGGVPPLTAPPRMISRAYLKIQEALLWSGLPLAVGDRCVEIGSAPGGSCLALLERGCVVTGIDPGEMDPAVLAYPNFTHVRARSKDVKHSVFRDCQWLVMDANVAPNYTLDTLAGILARPGVRPEALVLTLKLTDPALAAKLPELAGRIRALGFKTVRMRQLAFNRREVCAVATDPVPRAARYD